MSIKKKSKNEKGSRDVVKLVTAWFYVGDLAELRVAATMI